MVRERELGVCASDKQVIVQVMYRAKVRQSRRLGVRMYWRDDEVEVVGITVSSVMRNPAKAG